MIKNYKIVLQYDGSRYDGWQKQGNTGNTLQGKLEGILLKLTGRPVEVHGSGRTDAGVHALAQTANFHADTGMTEDQIRAYFNQYLPEDIAVLSVETVPDKFHSRLNAVKKTYLYRIEMGPKKDVFERKYCYGLGKPLSVKRMEEAAACVLGEHDFKSFCGNKKMKKSTVRTISDITFEKEGTKLLIRSLYGKRFFISYGQNSHGNADRDWARRAQPAGNEGNPAETGPTGSRLYRAAGRSVSGAGYV